MRKRIFLVLFSLLTGFMGMPALYAQEIGLQFYSLRNAFKNDVEGTLSQIQKWGITTVEGGETYGLPLGDFLSLLRKYELEVVSLLLPYEMFRDNPEEAIHIAKAYGAKYIGCAWIPHRENDFTIREVRHALEVFNRAGKLADDDGIQVFYHPHGYELRPYKTGTLLDYMISEASDFEFQLDVYWVRHGGQDPLALLEQYPDRFILMHMKDMAEGVVGDFSGHSDVRTNVVLGRGQIDIAGLMRKASQLGIPYVFIEDESPKSMMQIPLSLDYLKSLQK
ncbi:sugar phosphate isomerase/epimerase family protein [Robiginitalea aurantiaca]|uniref:Sugar phosphate isomerase/epimerase n=1 Tax=Robiginitalea aurantiaca TaxID=3056915 RepID=A0ABT7WI56_9FLAO|nr:sugar phosphate isomerase/epimerase [Robiginitalea aurantiaca]MDM9632590.1 sugar phosphate isomerase/epimerase [Robiginitalea aurantiaca]